MPPPSPSHTRHATPRLPTTADSILAENGVKSSNVKIVPLTTAAATCECRQAQQAGWAGGGPTVASLFPAAPARNSPPSPPSLQLTLLLCHLLPCACSRGHWPLHLRLCRLCQGRRRGDRQPRAGCLQAPHVSRPSPQLLCPSREGGPAGECALLRQGRPSRLPAVCACSQPLPLPLMPPRIVPLPPRLQAGHGGAGLRVRLCGAPRALHR